MLFVSPCSTLFPLSYLLRRYRTHAPAFTNLFVVIQAHTKVRKGFRNPFARLEKVIFDSYRRGARGLPALTGSMLQSDREGGASAVPRPRRAEGCSRKEKLGSVVVSLKKYANKIQHVREKLAQISQVMKGTTSTFPPRRRRPQSRRGRSVTDRIEEADWPSPLPSPRPRLSTVQPGEVRDEMCDSRGRLSQDEPTVANGTPHDPLLFALEALAAAAASASAIAEQSSEATHSEASSEGLSGAISAAQSSEATCAEANPDVYSGAISAGQSSETMSAEASSDGLIGPISAGHYAEVERRLPSSVENSGHWRKDFPLSSVIEDAVKTMLSSMAVEALNERMEIPCLPDEPLVKDLEGRDVLDFPSRQGVPADDEGVIPASILEKLLDAPDNIAMSGVIKVGGVELSRNDVDAARWMAYDAANDYLGRLRAARARRLPTGRPTGNGWFVQRLEGFRFYRSIEEAVMDVTKAVMSADGGCGSEPTPDYQTPLGTKREDWVQPEEDEYFMQCKLTEDILLELIGDTVKECKRVCRK